MFFWISAALLTALCVGLFWHALLQQPPVNRRHKMIAVLIALFTPTAALGLYFYKGSIGMPDFPAKALMTDNQRITESLLLDERPLIRQLRKEPGNEKLWLDLIALYLRTNRTDQAAQAYADARASVKKPNLLNNKALNVLRRSEK
jgi:cytochrome c-type biogenesis protein CcmH/NrfG